MTSAMPNCCAMRAAWAGPQPPYATSVYRAGSRPRSVVTALIACCILALATAWIPQAASANGNPIGVAMRSSITSAAFDESSLRSPPTRWSGLKYPSTTLASVMVGSVPPAS